MQIRLKKLTRQTETDAERERKTLKCNHNSIKLIEFERIKVNETNVIQKENSEHVT